MFCFHLHVFTYVYEYDKVKHVFLLARTVHIISRDSFYKVVMIKLCALGSSQTFILIQYLYCIWMQTSI